MKAISFLGTGRYSETTYFDGSQECQTKLFPVALCQFKRPSSLLVIVTEPARTMWLGELRDRLQPLGIIPEPVDIPDGHSVDDLWKIFESLTKLLKEGEKVIFDITHSLRTLPFLSFLVASYLRVAKRVDIRGVYYGAFEARQPASDPPSPTDRSPVFDLSPFMNLLEWTTATDQFLKTGNGQGLANLLKAENPATQSLAASIDRIAQSLHLLRPMDVMREAAELPKHIASAGPSVSRSVPPFATLLKRVEQDYGAFGLQNPMDYTMNARGCLARQLKMVEWYAEKGQVVHALSLAREWLPSLLCYHFNVDPMEKAEREDMELLLNGGTIKDNHGNVVKESPRLSDWSQVPNGKQLRALWGGALNLANLRNDVLHAGFRKNAKSVETIGNLTKQIIQELRCIAAAWGLEEEVS